MSHILNFWTRILDWFQDRRSRTQLIRSFNASAKESFVLGVAPVLLEASISKGCSQYKHSFSSLIGSGFRIKAFAGRQLLKDEIKNIGEVILANEILVRRMVVLGWDTLEVHSDKGKYGCRWQLHAYMMIDNGNGKY